MKIGIIGQGFVGNAVYQKFKNYYDVLTYDLDESKCNSEPFRISKECETIFIFLPTPIYIVFSCILSIFFLFFFFFNSHIIVFIFFIVIFSSVPPFSTFLFFKLF